MKANGLTAKIKKQELRVGNFVLCQGKVITVESIYDQGINLEIGPELYGDWRCEYDGYFEYEWFEKALIEPIELTEEWLNSFNFINSYDGNLDRWHYGINPITKDWMIEIKNIGIGFFYQNGHFKVPYVHTLQNLYFALTGEELLLKQG